MPRDLPYTIYMIAGLVQILLFQGLGELISKFILTGLPGPVIGLALLLAWLIFRGNLNPSLALVADGFSQYLGLLFVPAAVGVVLFLPQLREHAGALITALVVSVVLTIACSAITLKLLSAKPKADE